MGDAQVAVVAAAGDHQRLVVADARRAAERRRREVQRRQRLQQPEAGGEIVGDHARRHAAVALEQEIDVVGLEHEIADRQDQAVAVDDDARADADAAEAFDRASIVDGHDLDAHHRGARSEQRVLAQILLGRAACGGHGKLAD